MGDIRTLFAFAVRRKYLKENPCIQIEPIVVNRKTPGILSPRQSAKLLRVAYNRDRALCPWLALQLFCGIRAEEMDRLTVKNVILEKKMVHIPAEASKTGSARNVTIPENAMEWMAIKGDFAELRKDRKGVEKLRGVRNLKERFDRVRRQAGLFKHWPNRAMRHSSVTYLYALTSDENAVAQAHGHGIRVMLVNYNAAKLPSGEIVTKEMAQEYFGIRPAPMLRVLENVA
jgi:integrase/recombinase XerD